jgi:catechol 2,3-dioxygenase-like lactoylglutathione lyase family enzyme
MAAPEGRPLVSDLVRRVTIDHLTVPVADFERSRAFYRASLAPLGYREIEVDDYIAFGAPGSEDLCIEPGGPVTPRLHIAFAAASQEEVQAWHAAALAAGGTDNGAPGERPQYHPGYYAAFVLDPDGHNVEAVFHGR